jgi:hypothetical protein
MTCRKIVVAVGIGAMSALLFYSSAGAFLINPQCAVMSDRHDRIGCTCALENGGWIRHIHGKLRWNYANPHMDRVHQCIRKAGG